MPPRRSMAHRGHSALTGVGNCNALCSIIRHRHNIHGRRPMAVGRNTTPLIALDAVVLDTETTGLDPRKARIVEIAAVQLVGGRLDTSSPFRRLVQPGEPIPAAATRIHSIDEATVAGAATFAGVWPQFSAYIGTEILIGHTIGFDLALLTRECERIGKVWQAPPTLDTRLLAQVVKPKLADYSLETLSAWL